MVPISWKRWYWKLQTQKKNSYIFEGHIMRLCKVGGNQYENRHVTGLRCADMLHMQVEKEETNINSDLLRLLSKEYDRIIWQGKKVKLEWFSCFLPFFSFLPRSTSHTSPPPHSSLCPSFSIFDRDSLCNP